MVTILRRIGRVKGNASSNAFSIKINGEATARSTRLKTVSVKGTVLTLGTQGIKFVVQTATIAALARVLSPEDFGLQGMVLVLSGVLTIFRDIGLSTATVQRQVITESESNTLFWVNMCVGAILTLLTMALAPFLAAFYKEPRLLAITVASAFSFLIGAGGAQHLALIQRTMRFGAMAWINTIGLFASSALAVCLGALGCGYWALVASSLSLAVVSTVGAWIALPWLPGRPGKLSGIRELLRFGGTLTCNNLVIYLGYNAEKVMLGRAWGAESLGIYGRAHQLLNLPLQQLHGALYSIAFPALARVQDDPDRLGRSFLKGYSLLLSVTLPITLASGLFADDLIAVLMGTGWSRVAPVLRLLTPAIITFSFINPFGWFLIATNRAIRSLLMALVITPIVVVGMFLGLGEGPEGVAAGYSAAMCVLLLPMILWAIKGTSIGVCSYWKTVWPPVCASVISCVLSVVLSKVIFPNLHAAPRLGLELGFLIGTYWAGICLFKSQRRLIADMFLAFKSR
jgi:O-antigen/teichoic acid export membrane protein